MLRLDLSCKMCLVEDTEDYLAGAPSRGVGGDYRAAHIGARHDAGGGVAGRAVVVVESHYYFCITVIEGYGVDLDEDFPCCGDRKGSGREGEGGESGLRGCPLANFLGEGHDVR